MKKHSKIGKISHIALGLVLLASQASVAEAGFFSSSKNQKIMCQQVLLAAKPSWMFDKFNEDQLAQLKKLKFETVNNESQGYYLLPGLPKNEGHLGLGGDFNYTVMATAHSNRGVIYDIDPNVFLFHKVIRAGFLLKSNAADFINLFNKIESLNINSSELEALYSKLSLNVSKEQLLEFIKDNKLGEYFAKTQNTKDESGQNYTYLSEDSKYQHIRSLFVNDKIHIANNTHLEPEFFSELQKYFPQQKFSTIYISNSLEFRWLNHSKASDNDVKNAQMKDMAAMSGILDPEIIIESLNELSQRISKTQMFSANTKTSHADDEILLEAFDILFMGGYAIDSIKDAELNWRIFWYNMKSLNLSDNALMLSTNRDTVIFGKMFDSERTHYSTHEVKYDNGSSTDFKWIYAQIPKQKWEDSKVPEAVDLLYKKASWIRKKVALQLVGHGIKDLCSMALNKCIKLDK